MTPDTNPAPPPSRARRRLEGKAKLWARLKTFDDCPHIKEQNSGWEKGPQWAGQSTQLYAGNVFVSSRMTS
jgi:hypothetical protein